jgi:hypothetical protein
MSEYTAFLVNPSTGEKTSDQYIGTADYALERARADYPDLEVTTIHEGPSMEIRLQQIEEYGRVFSNDEEKRVYLKEKGLITMLVVPPLDERLVALASELSELKNEFNELMGETA